MRTHAYSLTILSIDLIFLAHSWTRMDREVEARVDGYVEEKLANVGFALTDLHRAENRSNAPIVIRVYHIIMKLDEIGT